LASKDTTPTPDIQKVKHLLREKLTKLARDEENNLENNIDKKGTTTKSYYWQQNLGPVKHATHFEYIPLKKPKLLFDAIPEPENVKQNTKIKFEDAKRESSPKKFGIFDKMGNVINKIVNHKRDDSLTMKVKAKIAEHEVKVNKTIDSRQDEIDKRFFQNEKEKVLRKTTKSHTVPSASTNCNVESNENTTKSPNVPSTNCNSESALKNFRSCGENGIHHRIVDIMKSKKGKMYRVLTDLIPQEEDSELEFKQRLLKLKYKIIEIEDDIINMSGVKILEINFFISE
jgi:hypothetical protein